MALTSLKDLLTRPASRQQPASPAPATPTTLPPASPGAGTPGTDRHAAKTAPSATPGIPAASEDPLAHLRGRHPAAPPRTIRGIYDAPSAEIAARETDILAAEEAADLCLGCHGDCRQRTYGMRLIAYAEGGRIQCAMQQCRYGRARRERARLEKLFQTARIPAIFARATWQDYQLTPENEEAVKAAKWFCRLLTERKNLSPRAGLYLYGPRGTGKTMLAALIARTLASESIPVLFLSVPDYFYELRASFGSTDRRTETLTSAARSAAVLILDDLGAERTTEWTASELFTLINHRAANALPTLVTSNYPLGQLATALACVRHQGGKNTLDDSQALRIRSRLAGLCEPVRLGGKDRRTE